jgi:hypothetical protein
MIETLAATIAKRAARPKNASFDMIIIIMLTFLHG